MSEGVVNVIPENGKLSIGSLGGDGKISLNSNFGNNAQQIINLGLGKGNYDLSIVDSSPDTVLPVKINLIDNNTDANFYLIGNAVDIGAYQYSLVENDDGWYLERSLNKTDTSIIAKNTYASLNNIFYAHFQNLKTRMGEIRNFAHNTGLWIRSFGRRLDLDYHDDSYSKTKIIGF